MDKLKRMEKIVELAIKSVEQFRTADSENNKWRKKHEHWDELNKIITDKEHLQVEALYDKASDTMDKVSKMFKQYSKEVKTLL